MGSGMAVCRSIGALGQGSPLPDRLTAFQHSNTHDFVTLCAIGTAFWPSRRTLAHRALLTVAEVGEFLELGFLAEDR